MADFKKLPLAQKFTFLSFSNCLYPLAPRDRSVMRTSKEGDADALPEKEKINTIHRLNWQKINSMRKKADNQVFYGYFVWKEISP